MNKLKVLSVSAIVGAALLSSCNIDPVSIIDKNPVLKEAAALPDLQVSSISFVSNVDGYLTYRVTIKNAGTVATPNLYTVVLQGMYSQNTVFGDTDDVGAGGFHLWNSTLAAGESKNIDCTIADHTWGNFAKKKLIVKVDYANTVAESNENNNIKYTSVLPDLRIMELKITSGAGSPLISTSVTIKNSGGVSIPNINNIIYQTYFSTDATYGNSDDIPAGGWTMGVTRALGIDSSYTFTHNHSRPASSAYKYLVAKIDNSNIVLEMREEINYRSVQLN